MVEAVGSVGLKYPRKHNVLMSFLLSMLRKKGGLEYKASIADAIIAIIEHNPDSKEAGLYRLCEFIEFSCEHNSLAVRILHLLGREGPRTKKPSKYNPFSFFRHHLIELTTNIKSIFNIGLGFVQLLIFQTVNGGYFKK